MTDLKQVMADKLPWRYLIVIVIGFGADFLVSMMLARAFGVTLTGAAAAGFVAGLLANYMLLEFWAFQRPESGLSLGRVMKTFLSGGAALVLRLTVVFLLGLIVQRGFLADGFVFVSAAGLSALLNYVLLTKIFYSSAQTSIEKAE